MRDRELFKACVSQCIWCEEQWPLVESQGHPVHVGPFTQDPKLFSTVCAANTIRKAFKYANFKGGKQVKYKARAAAELRQIIAAACYRVKTSHTGLGMNLGSPSNRRFWRGPIEATIEVASWPEWKRGSGTKPVSPEDLKQNRDELRLFDECDYVVRQPCSDNLRYRPHWNEKHTNLVKPPCNDGFGCTACWGLYETAYNKQAEKWCDY